MERIYENIVKKHYETSNEAIFLSGPRQVGKTTIAQLLASHFDLYTYYNWDNIIDRQNILQHHIEFLDNTTLTKPLLIFDEIHKYHHWKNFLKGLFDKYKDKIDFLITGSSCLNIYRRGGDSMMGRYFLYRIHPLSVGEILRQDVPDREIQTPLKINDETYQNLLNFGGFPKPFLKANVRFYNKWKNQRMERLFEEDIRDTLKIHESSKLQVLARILQSQAAQQINYTSLSKKIQISDQTVRSWIGRLEEFYYCFTIKPWFSNVTRSLLKEPKIYLWDWSLVDDKGQKYENFVASHLLKAVHFWTDEGYGHFDLFYLRDKDQHEVDFLITKDEKPWIMIEVKSSLKEPLSKSLYHFQKQLNVPYIFQLACEADYIDADCFSNPYHPMIVPTKTFLSQLV